MESKKPPVDPREEYFTAFNELAQSCPELARDLLGRLIDYIARINSRIIRECIAMVLLAFTFELLNRNLVGEASAFGFEVAKLGFLRYWIPVAIAFLLFHIFSMLRDRNFNFAVLQAICARTYPGLKRPELLTIFVPTAALLRAADPPKDLISEKAWAYRDFVDSMEIMMLSAIIPVGFTGYSLTQLFRQGKTPYIAPIIVTVLTVTFIMAAYMAFNITLYETDIPELKSGFGSPPDAAAQSDASSLSI